MKKMFLAILLILVGCDNPVSQSYDGFNITVTVPTTINLNEYEWQTIDFIEGNITYADGSPMDGVRIEWSSNLYWVVGDTLGYLVEFGLTDDLEWRSYDTTYITWFKGFEVPTINPVSYSDADGDFKIQVAPIQIMKGDTLKISYKSYKDRTFLTEDSIFILLR